jgi:hypothetical protein
MSCPASLSQFSVTGDCSNNGSGGITLYLSATAEPITITWIQPFNSPISQQYTDTVTSGTIDIPGLTAGLYILRINDSCGNPTAVTENNISTLNIYVSSASSCVNITNVVDTTCGLLNGSLIASTTNSYGLGTYTLYKDDAPFQTVQVGSNSHVFESLGSGIYYVIADDGGGCTGRSENCIVGSSTPVEFGTYIVDDADCGNAATGVGRIFITGLTGVAPYTYKWEGVGDTSQYLVDTGQPLTGVSITGLTAGFYDVTVTDSQGCSSTVTSQVSENPPVALGLVEPEPPTCFDSNGKITIEVIDGTPPYRYSIPSISYIDVSYSQTYVFDNLPGGFYSIVVTDAALCSFQTTVQLSQSNSFAIGSINTTPPTCGNANGSITISLIGNVNFNNYSYVLSGANGTIKTNSASTQNIFANLIPQNYLLTITDGICTYSELIQLNSSQLYTATANVTGSTCGLNNGIVTITKSTGGTEPFIYSIEKGDTISDQQSPPTSSSSYTFNNLSSGSYMLTIEDSKFCSEVSYFTVDASSQLDFNLVFQNSTTGNNGQIYTNILDGNPPYTLTWSSNVNGQTGLTVTNLSAGTYTLNIIDDDGCSLQKSVTLTGNFILSNNSLFEVCDSTLSSTGLFTERTLQKMLLEGYVNLTETCIDCLFSSATFSAHTIVAGTAFTQSFYTTTSLNNSPTEQDWYEAVENLLSGVTGIGEVVVDSQNNTITINTDCNESTTGLSNQTITVQLKIGYDINCVSCS